MTAVAFSEYDSMQLAMLCRRATGVIVVLMLFGCGASGGSGKAAQDQVRRPNRLANATSPYLRMHADNPVDWYPWGEEAFERARREQKPIFLSIGYSSCHWCHVMEEESFENEEIARILNEHFISIKVDREERPDIDEVYITAVQLMQGHAGWPLSVFLTPDGKPFFGGTYFPPEDRHGLPGFKTVLLRIAEAWQSHRAELQRTATQVMDAVKQQLQLRRAPVLVKLDRSLVRAAVAALAERFDPVYGGFGYSEHNDRIPKFPESPRLVFLLREADVDDQARKMLLLTLDKMATGGIYDQLGGGFHRYSTDRRWEVPHFEKMLYDNGQLLSVYAGAARIGKQPELYRRVVAETVRFLTRELRSPGGAFYAALDADSEGKEGLYYLWTDEELRAALDKDEYALAERVFGLRKAPRLEGRIVLCRRLEPQQAATALGVAPDEAMRRWDALRAKLLAVRERRVRPFRDEKIIAAWNGYVIAGLADVADALGEAEYGALAAQAARAVLDELWRDRRQLHRSSLHGSPGPAATLEDYAALVWALLRLSQLRGDSSWLKEARLLADQMIARFWDEERKSFWYVAEDHDVHLPVRPQIAFDGPVPGATSLAARSLVRLAVITGELSYARIAAGALRTMAPLLQRMPAALPTALLAIAEYRDRGLPPEYLDRHEPHRGPQQQPVVEVAVQQDAQPVRPGQTADVALRLRVADGWHIYAHDPGSSYAIPLSVVVETDPAVAKIVVKYPEANGTLMQAGETVGVLRGEVRLGLALPIPSDLAAGVEKLHVRCRVRYQACSQDRCLAPAEQVVEFSLPVVRQ